MTLEEINAEITTLERERAELVTQKRDIETKMVAIKNLVRTTIQTKGRMPNEQYKQCCTSQNHYMAQQRKTEARLAQIKARRSELHRMKDFLKEQTALSAQAPARTVPDTPAIVAELVKLRQHYQEFAADSTRVNSMRVMASEFVLKLNPIIKSLVNS